MNIGDTITVPYEQSKKLRKEGWKPRNDVVVMMYVGAPLASGTMVIRPEEFPQSLPRVKVEKNCSVHGCTNPHHGLGYCRKHHSRFKRHGDHRLVCQPGKRPHGKCDAPECKSRAVARGLCNLHYLRARKEQAFECREAA
jgi:hypothetical protein